MVCSPHRYIVAGVAQGIGYESGTNQTRTYTPLTYNASPIKQYEQQTATNYLTPRNENEETTKQKTSQYAYSSLKRDALFFATPPPNTSLPGSYVPLRPRQFIFSEKPKSEAPMTNQNTLQTKQKLAQLIMHELETLGPREEHTHEHEHGEHTHVH